MPTRYNPDVHRRRSIRRPGYDCTLGGAYFLTICTHQRELLFGEIADGTMRSNGSGEIVRDEWLRTASIRPEVQLDTLVVMPNHLHAIVFFSPTTERGVEGSVGAHGRAPLRRSPKSLGSFVAGFKASATNKLIRYTTTQATLSGSAIATNTSSATNPNSTASANTSL